MVDEKDKHLAGAKPNSTVEAINALVEARERLQLLEAAKDSLGGGNGKKNESESLAASIVTGAMNTSKNIMDTLQKEKSEAQASAAAAYQEADALKAQLYDTQIAAIKDVQVKLEKAVDEVKNTGKPDALVIQLQSLMGLMDMLEKRYRPAAPAQISATPVHQGLSEEGSIHLEEMRQNHELAMKKLELELLQRRQEWDLQMLQFKEDSERRWREYKDNQKFKQDGLAGFQDLVGSLGDSITRERTGAEGSSGIEEEAGEIPTHQEEEAGVAVETFPCKFCKNPVKIEPGADKAKCACGAEYDITRK